MPIWGFVIIAIAVYVIDGFVAYQLCVEHLSVGKRVISLTALFIVMLFNVLWNYALFESRNLLIGLLGLIAFAAPLAIL